MILQLPIVKKQLFKNDWKRSTDCTYEFFILIMVPSGMFARLNTMHNAAMPAMPPSYHNRCRNASNRLLLVILHIFSNRFPVACY